MNQIPEILFQYALAWIFLAAFLLASMFFLIIKFIRKKSDDKKFRKTYRGWYEEFAHKK